MKYPRNLFYSVPTEYLVHIGDVTVSFALLENTFQNLTGSLLGAKGAAGNIVVAGLSFRNLRTLTQNLYLDRNGKDINWEALEALIKKAGQLEERRNTITHSYWGSGRDESHICRLKNTAKEKQGYRFHIEEVTLADLAAFAEEIKNLAADVQAFWFQLLAQGKATGPLGAGAR